MPARTIATLLLRGLFFCMLLAVCACAHRPDNTQEQQQRIAGLASALEGLSPAVTTQEAQLFATTAVTTAADLRQQYGVRFTPWIHNIEVNSGTRSRGLCFHYARDLLQALRDIETPHLQLHLVCAHDDQPLEHNAIVVTARGAPWQHGLVLDAWRQAGALYYGPVNEDKYPWLLKPPATQSSPPRQP